MEKNILKKIIAIVFIILITVSLTLAVMNSISWFYFWGVAIVAAIVAFWALPKMK